MPGRNITRFFAAESHYHIYNRGVNKRKIFLEESDYKFFEHLLERHLDIRPHQDKKGRQYAWYGNIAKLEAYCLMGNHYHLLIYQDDEHAIAKVMLSIATAYTLYFNRKYNRRGPLFEDNYRASIIQRDDYLLHVFRYIHLNHPEWRKWSHESLLDYLGSVSRSWVSTDYISSLFDSKVELKKFTEDYETMQRELESIKSELADTYYVT